MPRPNLFPCGRL